MSIAATIRNQDSKVFANIAEFGKQSSRKIAQATGLSKDSVARSIETVSKRDKYPEPIAAAQSVADNKDALGKFRRQTCGERGRTH